MGMILFSSLYYLYDPIYLPELYQVFRAIAGDSVNIILSWRDTRFDLFYFILFYFFLFYFYLFFLLFLFHFFLLFIFFSFCFNLFYSSVHLFLCLFCSLYKGANPQKNLLFDPEIERSLRQLRREQRAVKRVSEVTMADENEQNNRVMKDYLAPTCRNRDRDGTTTT